MKDKLKGLRSFIRVLATDTELSRFVTQRDTDEIMRRIKAEGVTYLTITLPQLGKSLEAALRGGDLEVPAGWRCGTDTLPQFLHKAWTVLFTEDRKLRWFEMSPNGLFSFHHCSESSGAVRAIRQICLLCYKWTIPYSKTRVEEFTERFAAIDDELPESFDEELTLTGFSKSLGEILDVAKGYLSDLLEHQPIFGGNPNYGTGASANRMPPLRRWLKPRRLPRLNTVYPHHWFFWNFGHYADDRQGCSYLYEHTSRLTFVPKDARGPRTICMEQPEVMFVQQDILGALNSAVERVRSVARECSCKSQEPNMQMAKRGSVFGHLATIDMQDASDRNSCALVKRLFPHKWVEVLMIARSESCELPNGVKIPLKKYAPMGAATCFPIETLVFWSLCRAVYDDHAAKRYRVFRTPNPLRVYGDDIIVHHSIAEKVMLLLESVGLKVNRTKSYTKGPFRESCGADWFAGDDVSIVRVKNAFLPHVDGGHQGLFRIRDLFNETILRYGTHLSKRLQEILYEESDGRVIPYLTNKVEDQWSNERHAWITIPKDNGFALIALNSEVCSTARTRLNANLHRREVWSLQERGVKRPIPLGDRSLLVRWALTSAPDVRGDIYALPKRTKYKYGWVSL